MADAAFQHSWPTMAYKAPLPQSPLSSASGHGHACTLSVQLAASKALSQVLRHHRRRPLARGNSGHNRRPRTSTRTAVSSPAARCHDSSNSNHMTTPAVRLRVPAAERSFFAMLCVCALLVAPCVSMAFSPVPPQLLIGFQAPLDPSNPNAVQSGMPACFCFKLALDEINADSTLLPNTTLVPILNDTRSNKRQVLVNTLYQVRSQVVGIMGSYTSDDSEQISLLAGSSSASEHLQFTPQISWGSMSVALSDKELHPSFARTISTNAAESVNMIQFWRRNRWVHAAALYTSDVYAQTGFSAFVVEAGRQNISIVGSAIYTRSDSQDTVQEMLLRLKTSGARFFALFAVYRDSHVVFRAAQALGMTGKGYAWVLACGVFSLPADDEVYHAWNGSVLFCPSYGLGTARFNAFTDRYHAKSPDPQCPGFDPHQSTLLQPCAYAYDATYLFARALHKLLYEEHREVGEEESRRRLMQLIVNTTFDGVSGPVVLTPQGDRLLNSDVFNLRGDQKIRVLIQNNQSGFQGVPGAVMIWPGDQLSMPIDPFLPVSLTYFSYPSYLIFLVTALSVCTALAIFSLLYLVWHHRNSQLIKAASWRFLCLFIVGGACMALCGVVFVIVPDSGGLVCQLRLWLPTMFFCMLLTPLMLKTIRVVMIFQRTPKLVHIPDSELLLCMCGVMLCPVCMLLIQLCVPSLRSEYQEKMDKAALLLIPECSKSLFIIIALLFIGLFYVTLSLFLCWLLSVSASTSLFNESQHISNIIIFILLFSILIVPVQFLIEDNTTAVAFFRSFGTIFSAAIVEAILFVPKILVIVDGRQNEMLDFTSLIFNKAKRPSSSDRSGRDRTPVGEQKIGEGDGARKNSGPGSGQLSLRTPTPVCEAADISVKPQNDDLARRRESAPQLNVTG